MRFQKVKKNETVKLEQFIFEQKQTDVCNAVSPSTALKIIIIIENELVITQAVKQFSEIGSLGRKSF